MNKPCIAIFMPVFSYFNNSINICLLYLFYKLSKTALLSLIQSKATAVVISTAIAKTTLKSSTVKIMYKNQLIN